jgi:hypothetical protein
MAGHWKGTAWLFVLLMNVFLSAYDVLLRHITLATMLLFGRYMHYTA